jgi:glycosyltransferase involved in cell wall biosynthesis
VLSFEDARDAEDAALKTLYISYFGMTKHLSHSQVIPYLRGLTAAGIDVTLLSFEEKLAPAERESEELASVGRLLAASKIKWRWRRYHKRPSVPATAYDVVVGTIFAAWLVMRNRIDVVHSRGYVPLPMALFCKWFCGAKLVFDVRGLMAEEYVDAGHWKKGSLPFRITKWFERRAFRNADAVIVLTERVRDILRSSSKELQASKAPVHVIPCCAEVERFGNTGDRDAIRQQLGIAGDPVLAYVGSLGAWYMGAEMVRFFKELLRLRPKAILLILTQTPEVANSVLDSEGMPRERYVVRTVSPEQVPNMLNAADAGVAFIKPCYSKISSSPTKIAEYLAAGLPIVSNRGIGDLDALVEGESVGTLVKDFTPEEYSGAVKKLVEMLDHDNTVRQRCKKVAQSKFSMKDVGQPAYVNLYRELETRSQ